MRFFILMMVGFVVTACQPQTLRMVHAPPLVAENPQQIRPLAMRAESYSKAHGAPMNLSKYDFFTANSFGRNWLKQRNHKVITIGHPKDCATFNGRWRHGNLFEAMERSMNQCLNRVKVFSEITGKKCGCRYAAINNAILMKPEELPFRVNVPAIALVKDAKGRKEILGYASTTGRTGKNQAMNFHTSSGRKVCDGHYNIGTIAFKGDAYLNCFDGRIKGPAVFKVHGFREGISYGTALVNAGENKLILVYGLPTKEFEKRRSELLGEW
ncbi:hypothetical protein MTBPR1_50144 [Candidatus Terasakiella magnetica]|uniref:Lipoprotein n=2 Tax=Candidatus Terasakiella magnetica TaxID=1867952 RepID=A0A1C3RJE3_9PROT|nr:hypothetical protein MTBPR1_50144 [Candidatus Terasakiella magnetica]